MDAGSGRQADLGFPARGKRIHSRQAGPQGAASVTGSKIVARLRRSPLEDGAMGGRNARKQR